jgi:molecular chaperone DnaK (HSP70)
VGIVKAEGFVSTVMENNQSLSLRKIIMFTTSIMMDKQATATIQVVVGTPPKGEDNTVIAELILEDLIRRPRGVPHIKDINVTFNVEQMGKTQIMAEELMEDSAMTDSTASIQLKEVIRDTLTGRDGHVQIRDCRLVVNSRVSVQAYFVQCSSSMPSPFTDTENVRVWAQSPSILVNAIIDL